jgi:ERF superfamily protein
MATSSIVPRTFQSETVETTTPLEDFGVLRSGEIGKLAEALAKAQKVIKAPKKGRTASIKSEKGAYEYSYADLADVIDAYRDPLADQGLALSHALRFEDGHMVLVTLLLHTSGQWIGSEFPIPNYARPQEQGSALTYARRYAVSALLGIAAEDDDDGQRAQHARREETPERTEMPPPSGDAAKCLELAEEIQQWEGSTIDEIITEHSSFTTDDGKVKSFSDPTKVTRNPKWLKGTRGRLEATLQKIRTKNEPGAGEGPALFK